MRDLEEFSRTMLRSIADMQGRSYADTTCAMDQARASAVLYHYHQALTHLGTVEALAEIERLRSGAVTVHPSTPSETPPRKPAEGMV